MGTQKRFFLYTGSCIISGSRSIKEIRENPNCQISWWRAWRNRKLRRVWKQINKWKKER